MLEYFDQHWYKIELDNKEVRYLPSTTTKLQCAPKPFLARWRGDVGNREADLRLFEAGEKGTRIHYAASVLAREGVVIYNPYNHPNYTKEQIEELQLDYAGREIFIFQDQDEMWQVAKFKAWLDEVNPEIVFFDKIVYDLENNEAGTIDFVFKIKSGTYNIAGSKPLTLEAGYYIADLKSSKQLQTEYDCQVADYTKMAANQIINEDEIRGGLLIHTNALKTKKGIEGLTTKFLDMNQIEEDYKLYRHIAAVWERTNPTAHPKMIEFPSLITLKEPELGVDDTNESL